jgi:integrase
MRAYALASAAAPAPIGIARSKPGSVAAAVAAFLVSPQFLQRAKGTQGAWRPILNKLRDVCGEQAMPLPPALILGVLGKKPPHAARSWFKVIRALCAFCVEAGMIKADPTAGMKRPKVPKSDGHHSWIEDELAAYREHHPVGSKARLALELGILTLQRRSDVVEMGRQHIASGQVIKVRGLVVDKWLRAMSQQKTKTKYDIPMFPELTRVLAATPSSGHLNFLISKSGRPYSPNDFSEQFRAWCDEAGLPQRCTFHGLRKAGCIYFAERGCGAPEIAAWSGDLSLREVQKYIDQVNKKKLAANALRRVLEADADDEAQEQNGMETVKPERTKL